MAMLCWAARWLTTSGRELGKDARQGLCVGDIGLEAAGLRVDIGHFAAAFPPEAIHDGDLVTGLDVAVPRCGNR
jgi:hypothetical protein